MSNKSWGELERVGIDVGFGYTKTAVLQDGAIKTLSFPSVMGRAESRSKVKVGLGGGRVRRAHNVTYNGEQYLIGSGAIIESRMAGTSRQDAERIGSDVERILMLTGLARAGISDALVVTGLPVLWWKKYRQRLIKSWTGEHRLVLDRKEHVINVRQVLPVWQPAGTFYDRFLSDAGVATENGLGGRGFGVVDIGFCTTDFSGIVGLNPIARLSGGIQAGVRDALGAIAAYIEEEYQVTRETAELSEALMGRGSIRVFKELIPLEELAESACTHLAHQLVSASTGKWGQGDRFDSIFITGGGAALVGRALKAAFPKNAEIVKKSAMANARGFAKYAQRRVFKVDQA